MIPFGRQDQGQGHDDPLRRHGRLEESNTVLDY